MYEAFYGLREKPFALLPDPSYLYLSDKHSMALVMLEYGLSSQAGFSVITGGIGTGKTTLIRHLLNRIGRDVTVGLISHTHRSFGELLQWILMAYNLEYAGKDKVQLYETFVNFLIREYARRRRTVLIVDEAQNMSVDTLEELRMLSNINADKNQVLQVMLVGQGGLRETLRRPDMEQFAQRIAVDYHLEPLGAAETAHYVRHRVKIVGGDEELFEDDALQAVFENSGGTPRLINLLCDTALVFGYAEQSPVIGRELVEDVAREKRRGGIFPHRKPVRTDTPDAGGAPDAEPDTGRMPNGADRAVPRPVAEPVIGRAMVEPAEPLRAARPPLRVGILSDLPAQRSHLRMALQQCGVEVVADGPLEARTLHTIGNRRVDAVLANLDDAAGQAPEDLARIGAAPDLPVLFTDSTSTAVEMAGPAEPYGRALLQRLMALLERHREVAAQPVVR